MQKFGDLRFIIGCFFFLSGMMLLAMTFFFASQKPYGQQLNLYSGLAITFFGAFMLGLWWREKL